MRCVPAGLIKRALASKLPPASLTVALRLLLSTPVGSNSVTLTKEEFMALADDDVWDTARSKLTTIRQSGLAHITTNHNVYVTWLDASGGLHEPFPRVEIHAPTRENSSTDELGITQLAPKTNHPRVKTQAPSPGDNSTRVENHAPAREKPRADAWKSNKNDALVVVSNNNSTDQSDRSVKLLTAAGMPETDASRYAQQHQYEWLEKQTFAFWRDLNAGKVFHWRALCKRIDQRFRADPLTDEDRQSELWISLYGEETDEDKQRRESEERKRKYALSDDVIRY